MPLCNQAGGHPGLYEGAPMGSGRLTRLARLVSATQWHAAGITRYLRGGLRLGSKSGDVLRPTSVARILALLVVGMMLASQLPQALRVEAAGGSFSEFATSSSPYGSSAPDVITVGPDNALWFTEVDGNSIGRITTSGSLTEFPITTPIPSGTGSTSPKGIALGPDGALWFTETAGNNVVRITSAGVMTPYSVGPSSPFLFMEGITAGPGDAMWFTVGGAYNGTCESSI